MLLATSYIVCSVLCGFSGFVGGFYLIWLGAGCVHASHIVLPKHPGKSSEKHHQGKQNWWERIPLSRSICFIRSTTIAPVVGWGASSDCMFLRGSFILCVEIATFWLLRWRHEEPERNVLQSSPCPVTFQRFRTHRPYGFRAQIVMTA